MSGGEIRELRSLALARGAALFGVADLGRIRSETDLLDPCYNSYTRGISIGVTVNPEALADIRDQPTRGYCEEYLRINHLLDEIAEEVTNHIMRRGARAERIPASQVVDWERLRGHLPHKLIGRYAGLGWIGKSILLVNPTYGARVRYVTVLTDLPLEAQSPLLQSCGKCGRCARACPAKAIADEPGRFNMRACFEQLARFNEVLGEPHFICGVCVSVCTGKSARAGANDGADSDTAAG